MSVNKVILLGNLGRDPEVRYMPNGEAVTNFSIATSESWRDKSGERVTRTEWHNITLYRRLAEVAGQYLKKGSQVYIEGRIQSRKYTGKDGVERTAYEIIGNEMKMISARQDSGSSAPMDQDYEPAVATSAPQATTPPPAPRKKESAPAPVVDDFDDDIPF